MKKREDIEEIGEAAEAPAKEDAVGAGGAGEAGGGPIEEFPEEKVRRLEEELAAKKSEAAENHDRYLRALADLDNFKKRWERERAAIISHASEGLIEAVLPVFDNLERALEHAGAGHEDKESLAEGVRLTMDQMLGVLRKYGLREIESVGRRFDPSVHHAISHEDAGGAEPGTVVRVFQKGYFLKDRLLRPAMVAVAGETEGGGGAGETGEDE